MKQSLNPLQLKKSYNFNSQRLIRTIEKKEKEKDIIISVNKGYKDVLTFLQELNMGNFIDDFINNGITDKEKLLYLTNDNLKLLKIPYAYRFRVLKKLKEEKNLENMKKHLNEKGRLSKIKLKKDIESKYEEIIMPKEEDDKEIDDEEMRKTFSQAVSDFQKTQNSFNNFSINDKNEEKDIYIKDEENIVETGEYIEKKNKLDTNNVKQLLPLNTPKILCYFCFKPILKKEESINIYEKIFCSKKCLMFYEKENFINCKVCSKKLKKIDSLPSFNNRNVYYCSLNCLEQLEPERKNWIKKNLIDDEEIKNFNIINNKIDILDL